MNNMLSTINRIIQLEIRPHVNYLSTLKYHSSSAMYSPTYRTAKFTEDEELKILNTVNSCTMEEFVKYDIKEHQLKKLLAYREKNGNFQTFDDIIITQNVTPLIKLCKSILSGGKTRKIEKIRVPKSLVTPNIDKYSKMNIKKTLALHVWRNEIYWAMIDKNKNLSHWNFTTFQHTSKVGLVPLINLIIEIVLELPYADAYVMEADQYKSLSKLKSASYIMHLQRQQAITTIISALGLRDRGENDEIKLITNFYTLQARTSARKYNLNLGSENISAESIVANILAGSQNNNEKPLISVEPDVLTKYTSSTLATREHLHTVLLVALTFIDLLDNENLIKTEY